MLPSKKILFADVILPLALENVFTYIVPVDYYENISVGKRVIVPFGKNKLYSAIVYNIHENAPSVYKPKAIEGILDDRVLINKTQFVFWKWISDYYLCTLGEVMNAALPSGLKLSSETRFVLNLNREVKHEELSDKEYLIVEALELRNILSVEDVKNILHQKTYQALVNGLLEKQIILIFEELKHKFRPRLETFVSLSEFADNESNLPGIFDKLLKAPKQLELLTAFITLSNRYNSPVKKIRKKDLMKKCGDTVSAAFNTLVKKDIFHIEDLETGRFANNQLNISKELKLTEQQDSAFQKIKMHFDSKDAVLLHGYTGSGKTEIYIELIKEQLALGKQVLYLLPEISLTVQIIQRLKLHFGDIVGVYHSRFNENERVEIWMNIVKEKRFQIILGARSSLLLPFKNLGLIIVDEEHDPSYKQSDPAPRYHARNAAIYLATLHKAKVLMGSATPSVETYYNAKEGKFGLVELFERYGSAGLPDIATIDTIRANAEKKMKGHFSEHLVNEIEETLNNKKQVILFQNRRGYVPMIECKTCGHVPQCRHCDVSLTYHKGPNTMRCHYCGYQEKPPKLCAACGSVHITFKGFGTEKIEDDLKIIFPAANISRMDLDTTRNKNNYNNLINEFEAGSIDIMIGTQMISKGFDFENVALVGVLGADSLLHYPDFRSHERAYQLMSQVSGRAGRKAEKGKVFIQTTQPNDAVIKNVIAHDYQTLYNHQIAERETFQYPPFFNIIEIKIKSTESQYLDEAADHLKFELQNHFGKRVLGPEYAVVARVNDYYIKCFLIKIEKKESYAKAKELLKACLTNFSIKYKRVRVTIDVDI